MTPGIVALIMFSLLIVLILLRIPISFSLAFAVLPILVISTRVPPTMLLQRMMNQLGSFIMLAIPFFLLAANLMNQSGITKKLLKFPQSVVGHLRGGLAHVNILVSMLFAGISGSSNADAAGLGSILIPAMIDEGYDAKFSVAVTSCSAVMGNIIPPSITMVVWGGIMSTSVAGLFLAGFIPGMLVAGVQMALVVILAKKRNYPINSNFNLKEVGASFKVALPPLFTPIIIIGGIVGGFVTPTEASFVAVIYSIILGVFLYRTLKLKDIKYQFKQTAKLASIILFAVGTAAIYGWVLAYFKIPGFLTNILGSLTNSPTVMLFLFVLIFLIVGTFMDSVPAIVILGPLLRPVAESVGIHPLHFAIVGIVALAFGLVTPPYGLCLLISSEIANVNCRKVFGDIGLFLLAMLLVLIFIIVFPNIVLFLPKLFMPELF